MFDNDAKIAQRMAPMLERVLIADPQVADARQIADVLRGIAPRAQIWAAPTTEKALKLAATADPMIIFVEASAPGLDGLEFTRKLRRSGVSCRMAPVIMITQAATAAGILAARDVGVHEFLRKPFTAKDLMRRLEAVTLRGRDWIEAVDYVGPDRRRFNSGDYKGPLKRHADTQGTPDEGRIAQALKIIRSALASVDRDPHQAFRALQTQTLELHKAAVRTGDNALSSAAATLARHLSGLDPKKGRIDVAELQRQATPLLAFLPKEAA